MKNNETSILLEATSAATTTSRTTLNIEDSSSVSNPTTPPCRDHHHQDAACRTSHGNDDATKGTTMGVPKKFIKYVLLLCLFILLSLYVTLLDTSELRHMIITTSSTKGDHGYIFVNTTSNNILSHDDDDDELNHEEHRHLSNSISSHSEEQNDAATKSIDDDDDKRLNVIILYPDDWRYDDIGDEHPVLKTPFFTKLALDGIRFTHNAVTTAICWISRATLFTGQHASRHGSIYLFRPLFAHQPDRWQHTWPYLLQQAGYYVGHVGKWQFRDQDGYARNIFNYSVYYDGFHWWPWRNKTRIHATDRCKYDALKFLREIKPNQTPFALTVAFFPPKGNVDPNEVVPETMDQYQHAFFPEPYNQTHAYEVLPYFLQDDKTEARKRFLYRFGREQSYQDGMKAYYAMISHIDTACQEIVEEIKQQGLYEKTMIIVTSDHGEFHGSHALADKWYPYQESIRTPLIIHDPRIPPEQRGRLDDSITLNIDLAATILGAAGLPADPLMQGRDIADLYLHDDHDHDDNVCSVPNEQCRSDHEDDSHHLVPVGMVSTGGNITNNVYRRNREPWRTEFFYHFPMINRDIPQSSAVVSKDWKYTYWKDYNYEQLFHIAYDPMEMNDLINQTEYSDILQDMRKTHRKLQLEAYAPNIPWTRCDEVKQRGKFPPKLPRCHCLPKEPESLCCCPLIAEDEQEEIVFFLTST